MCEYVKFNQRLTISTYSNTYIQASTFMKPNINACKIGFGHFDCHKKYIIKLKMIYVLKSLNLVNKLVEFIL